MDPWVDPPTETEIADALQRLERWGGQITGEPWALLAQTEQPLEETVIVIAATESVYHKSSGRPTGISVQGIEVGGDYAVRIEVLLFDRPTEPMSLAPVLNPAAQDARNMLADLAGAQIWPLVFIDQHTGRPIGRRMMRVEPDVRQSLRQILQVTEGRTISQQRWDEIATLITDQLG